MSHPSEISFLCCTDTLNRSVCLVPDTYSTLTRVALLIIPFSQIITNVNVSVLVLCSFLCNETYIYLLQVRICVARKGAC